MGQSTGLSNNCAFFENNNSPKNLLCNYLEVPEHHGINDGRKIKIAYAVIKAKTLNSELYPLIYLTGGPGGYALTDKQLKQWSTSELNEKRDIIIFDQRGINHSSALPNISQDLFKIQALNGNSEDELKWIGELFDNYRTKANDEGISLKNFNSFQNAKDIGLLMNHLGYTKYNLYGVSYGTRLARIVQDMYPDKINSVILNSPAPLKGDFLVSRLRSYALALERIFNYCENNKECSATYPNPRETYIQAIEELGKNPIKLIFNGKEFFVNPQDGLYLIRRKLYGNDSRKAVPSLIYSLKNRESKDILNILESSHTLFSNYNSSMWISVECYEQFNFQKTASVIDSLYNTPLFPAQLGLFTPIYLSGKKWHNKRLSEDRKEFKMSNIPTIIFVNQYDPVTPPENGVLFQKKLTNSKLFILDEGGHGGGNQACREKVMIDFMDDPLKVLDTSCLNLYDAHN